MAKDKELKEVKVERKYVDVDTNYKDVLQWDKDGHNLVFVSEVKTFKILTTEQLKELSERVKKAYRFSKEDYNKKQGMFKDDLLGLLDAGMVYGSPTEQLNIELDGTEDFVVQWVAADKVKSQMVHGWGIVTDELKTQRGLRAEGYHAIGKNELILMKTSKENAKRLKADRNRLHNQLIDIQKDNLKEAADRAGLEHSANFSSEAFTL